MGGNAMQNCPICGGTVGDGVCLSCGYKIPTEKDIVTPVNNSDTPDWAEMDSISVPSAESVSQELAPKPASYANAKKYIPEPEKEEKRLPPPTNYTHISYTPEETHEEPPKASEIFARGFVDEVKKHWWKVLLIAIVPSAAIFMGIYYLMKGGGWRRHGFQPVDPEKLDIKALLTGFLFLAVGTGMTLSGWDPIGLNEWIMDIMRHSHW